MGKGEDKHQRDRRRATHAELARKAEQREKEQNDKATAARKSAYLKLFTALTSQINASTTHSFYY